MADAGTDSYEREKGYHFMNRETDYYKHLTKALERIKDGSFGVCAICGNLIPEEWMMEVPNATKCVQCKENEKLNIWFKMPIYGLIVVIVALDQWSKWAIKTSFNLYQSKPVIQDLLHFTYVTNDGMAFGLSFPGGRHILLIMTILLTGFIIGFLWKKKMDILSLNMA